MKISQIDNDKNYNPSEPNCQIVESHNDPSEHNCQKVKNNNDPSEQNCQKHKNNDVYVGNMLRLLTEQNLRDFFWVYGSITSIKLITIRRGESKGFWSVSFEYKADSNQAIENTNEKLMNEKQIFVTKVQKSHKPQ